MGVREVDGGAKLGRLACWLYAASAGYIAARHVLIRGDLRSEIFPVNFRFVTVSYHTYRMQKIRKVPACDEKNRQRLLAMSVCRRSSPLGPLALAFAAPLCRLNITHSFRRITMFTAARAASRSGVRFASTQAAVSEAAATARGAAKEGLGEAKGALKETEGAVKSTAQSAKAALPSAPSAPSAPIVVGSPTIRRPVGSVRGGVLGFLFGFGIASAYGYAYLLKEYNAASNLMLASVEELQSSTEKITTHLQRLNKLEADLKSLGSQAASRAEFEKNRAEIKRIVDGIHDEVLDVKKQVIGMHASLPPFLIQSHCTDPFDSRTTYRPSPPHQVHAVDHAPASRILQVGRNLNVKYSRAFDWVDVAGSRRPLRPPWIRPWRPRSPYRLGRRVGCLGR